MDTSFLLKDLLQHLADGNKAGTVRTLKEMTVALEERGRLLPVAYAAHLLNMKVAPRILIAAHQVPDGVWFHKRAGEVRYQMLDHISLSSALGRNFNIQPEEVGAEKLFCVTDDGRISDIKKSHKVYVYPPQDWWKFEDWKDLLEEEGYIEDDGDNWVQIRAFEISYEAD
jgi:hypothetical protein